MRILELCRILWNGGVQRVAIAQTLELRKTGHECDLVFLRSTGEVFYSLPAGSRVLYTDSSRPRTVIASVLRAITMAFYRMRGAAAAIDLDIGWAFRRESRSYDVMIFNDQYAAIPWWTERILRTQPYVLMLHEFFPRQFSRGLGRLLVPLAQLIDIVSILIAPAVVTISRENFELLSRIRPEGVFLARNGCTAPTPHTPVLKRDRHHVVSISVWDKGRFPRLYSEIARRLPTFKFTLIGSWTDQALQKRFEEETRTLSNFTVTGPVSESDRDRLMSDALVYMRFGFGEHGPGMGGLEALSLGSIVVTNPGLGLSEVITDGVDGFVVDPFTVDHAVDTLSTLDRMTPSILESVSLAAQDLCRELSWAEHARVLERAIAAAVAKTQRKVRRATRT